MKVILCAVVKFVLALAVLVSLLVGMGMGMDWLKEHAPWVVIGVLLLWGLGLLSWIFWICYESCKEKASSEGTDR